MKKIDFEKQNTSTHATFRHSLFPEHQNHSSGNKIYLYSLFFFFKTKGNQAYNQGKKINSADHIFLIIWYSQID